jgi:predicted transcriptional regulator
MNIIEGLTSYKSRKGYSNIQLAELLGCSSSVVSLYLSGKSGLSLEKLAILLKDGMSLEEAFGEDVATAIKSNIKRERPDPSGSLQVVIDGLRMLLEVANR